jgi:hypothetical protein
MVMLSIKPGQTGARIAGLRVEALAAWMVAASVYAEHGEACRLTAGLDSKHMPASLHYVGLAIDIGPPPAEKKAAILADLKAALADDFDVVEEGDHFHVEFQPKRGVNL